VHTALSWRILLCTAISGFVSQAQVLENATNDPVRVTVSVNQDGSRTTYEFAPANRKATATTASAAGKPVGKIHYELDDLGRFATGEVFGASGRFQFKALYKYDASGRLTEEARLTKEGTLLQKLVYAYGQEGKQTGYSVYDGTGKLLGQTKPVSTSPPAVKPKKTK